MIRRPNILTSKTSLVLLSVYGSGAAVPTIRRNLQKASMAAPRNLMGESGRLLRDEENPASEEDDSPSGKKPKSERFPLTRWEFFVALGVFFILSIGLFCIYLTMPATDYVKLKLPRNLSDLRMLKFVPLSIPSSHFSFVWYH